MDLDKFYKIFKDKPGYRLRQAKKAVFQELIDNWDDATTLPEKLRKDLSKECPLSIHSKLFHSRSSPTIKALVILKDGNRVETVLMKHKEGRNTVCVSSQVGCKLGCKFCATGAMGFIRDLKWHEIIEQVVIFSRILKMEKQKVTNVVFMGMGEPFLNYDNVIEAVKCLNDKEGFNIGSRKISVSTVGIVPGIYKLAREPLQVNLAISFHAPNDKLRSRLMPVNKKYPLKEVLKAVDSYIADTNRKVMFEYIMLKGVNDDLKLAKELADLLKGKLCMVNLIPCNEVCRFTPSDKKRIKSFIEILKRSKIEVVQRYSFGQDIDAACGQLANRSI